LGDIPFTPKYLPELAALHSGRAVSFLAIKTGQAAWEVYQIPAMYMANELFDFLWSSDHPYPFVVLA